MVYHIAELSVMFMAATMASALCVGVRLALQIPISDKGGAEQSGKVHPYTNVEKQIHGATSFMVDGPLLMMSNVRGVERRGEKRGF